MFIYCILYYVTVLSSTLLYRILYHIVCYHAGKELVNWLRVKLLTPSETEALHLANALCRLGFIVPVNERQHTVKLDSSCYRIQVSIQYTSVALVVACQ